MRRPLPILALLLVLAGLLWVVLQPAEAPEPADLGDRPTTNVETATAAAAEAGRTALREAPEAAPFDNRQVKVGAGRHGLYGTVVDEAGKPVPEAWVAAYSVPFPLLDFEFDFQEIFDKPLEFSLEPLAATFADAEGRFELAGLQGRTLYLTGRTHQRLTPRRQRVPPEALDTEEGVVLRTVAAASISGQVLDASGAPVAGAEVLVGPGVKYLVSAFRNRNFFMERVYTGADGSFQVEAVPAGITLTTNAFHNTVESGIGEFGPLARNEDAQVSVRLGATGALSGAVLDLEDQPVARADVLAVPLDLRYVIPFLRDIRAWSTSTDARGAYRFDRLPQAMFLLLAQSGQGRSGPRMARVTGPGSLAPELVIDTKSAVEGRVVDGAGKPLVGALVQLQSIPSGEEERDGRDVMNTPGGIFFEAAREILPELLPQGTAVRTDGRGAFRIPAWSRARLRVSAQGFPDGDFRLGSLDDDERPVLQMHRPGTIRGRLLSEEDDRPVRYYLVRGNRSWSGGAEMVYELDAAAEHDHAHDGEAAPVPSGPDWLAEGEKVLQPEASWRAQLNGSTLIDSADGRFELVDVPSGTWRLTFQAEGYENTSESVELPPGEEVNGIEVRIGRGATIRGRVLTASTSQPLAGAVVTAGRGEESGFLSMLQGLGESVAMAETAEDGSFVLTGVPEGADHVSVAADGFASASERVPPLEAGEVRERVEIRVMDGGTITGLVVDRNGVPLPGRMVGAMSIQARDFQQTAADEEGRYTMANMRPGSYFMVAADLEDESLFAGDFMTMLGSSRITTTYVKDGQVTTLDIVDPSAGGCRLQGKLIADGQPVPGANMVLLSAEGGGLLGMNLGFSTSRTDENGEFLFKSVAPGEYRVQIESRKWRGALPLEVWEIPEDYQVLEVPISSIRGTVVSAQGGSPVEGASVSLVNRDASSGGGIVALFGEGARERKWARTSEDGSFVLEGVTPGRYSLEISSSSPWRGGGQPEGATPLGKLEIEEFSLGENERKDLGILQLPVAGAIEVTALRPDGSRNEGDWFQVSARLEGSDPAADAGGGPWGRANSSWGSGSTTISGLEAGTYVVVVEGNQWVRTEVGGVVVRPGETAAASVVLTKGVQLQVRVLDASNNPISPSDIAVLAGDGKRMNAENAGFGAAFARMFGQPETDLGTFRPGFYTIRVTHQGRSTDHPVTLTEGEGRKLVELRH